MKIAYTKKFDKQLVNLPPKKQDLARAAIKQFKKDLQTGNSTPSLRRHSLTGNRKGCDSISAGGDLRLHYEQIGENIIFVEIGTHSQLYK
ncbi:MAG: type II toxin-antitoxin system YafQ family toxin [Defluviitaleaceae bacterium]|nr:type II toxin-antitoxin system YafQ family toxin [Defluviitaleaceae bacterium]